MIAVSYLIIVKNGFGLDLPGGILILAFVLSNIVAGFLPGEFALSRYYYPAWALTDIVMVTVALFAFGSASPDIFIMYFFVIMLSSIGENLATVLMASSVSTIVYAAYLFTVNGAVGPELFIRVIFLFGVAMFNGFVVENIRQERQKRRILEEEKDRLKSSIAEEEEKIGKFLGRIKASMSIVDKDGRVLWPAGTGALCFENVGGSGPCPGCLEASMGQKNGISVRETTVESDGVKRRLVVSTSRMADGRLICVTHDVSDITDMEQELGLKRKSLAFLHSLADSASRGKTRAELFSELMDFAQEMFGFESVAVVEREGDCLVPKEVKDEYADELRAERFGLHDSLCGIAAMTREQVVVRDMELFSASYAVASKKLGLKCVMSIPVYRGKNLAFVMNIGSRHQRNIDRTHINVFTTAGNIISSALCQPPQNAT